MKSTLRWIAGAVLGPFAALGVTLLLPDHSAQATSAGMANIAYALAFIRHLVVFGILYGLVFPALLPRTSTKPIPSLLVGTLIAAALLTLLYCDLDLTRPGGADFFASVTWRSSIIATAISMPLTFFSGLRGNAMLMNAMYWSRLLKLFR